MASSGAPSSLQRATIRRVSERWRRSFSRSWAFSFWARISNESRERTKSRARIRSRNWQTVGAWQPPNHWAIEPSHHRTTRIAARTRWFNGIPVYPPDCPFFFFLVDDIKSICRGISLRCLISFGTRLDGLAPFTYFQCFYFFYSTSHCCDWLTAWLTELWPSWPNFVRF